MIQLTAEITIFTEENGNITSISDTIETHLGERVSPNNVSCKLSEVLNKTEYSSDNPFIIGASKIGDKHTISSGKKDYFIGNILSDANGEFRDINNDAAYINIDLFGSIKSATILFDVANGGHPKKIVVDGHEFSDDDPIFTISDTTTIDLWDEKQEKHYIMIYGWTKPNRPLIIQGIYITPQTVLIDRKNIISLEDSVIDRSDIEQPSWGIISNGGKIEFKDTNGEIKDYAEQGFLVNGLPCKIYLEDTISKLNQKVVALYTTDWDYDSNTKICSVSISDKLQMWQNDTRLEYLRDVSETALSILRGTELAYDVVYDAKTEEHLREVTIPFPYLRKGSKWSRINDICVASQCYLFVDKDADEPRIKYYDGE